MTNNYPALVKIQCARVVNIQCAPTPVVWHDLEQVLSLIAPKQPRGLAQHAYAKFVAAGRGVRLWSSPAIRGQIYLGDEAFAARMQALLEIPLGSEVPHYQQHALKRPLAEYFNGASRDQAIQSAYLDGAYSQTEIAAQVGLSVSRISRILSQSKERLAKGLSSQ